MATGTNTFTFNEPKGQKHIVDLVAGGLSSGTRTGKLTIYFVSSDGFTVQITSEDLTAGDAYASIPDCSIFLNEGDGIKWVFESMTAGDLGTIGLVGH